jgi:hypothetical protein
LAATIYSDRETEQNRDVLYSIERPKLSNPMLLIDKTIELKNPQNLLWQLGNMYRVNFYTNPQLAHLREKSTDGLDKEIIKNIPNKELTTKESIMALSPEEATALMDLIAFNHPYHTYQCHGCDCFFIPSKAPSFQELRTFCDRYPHAIVGGILNTTSHKSGSPGQHWIAALFMNKYCYFMCSFGKSESSLSHYQSEDVYPTFAGACQDNGFTVVHNETRVQRDNYNCGIYSLLFNLSTLICVGRANGCGQIDKVVGNLDPTKIVEMGGDGGCYYSVSGANGVRLSLVGTKDL